jgi:hypothetical protein
MTGRNNGSLYAVAFMALLACLSAYAEGPDPSAAMRTADAIMYPSSFSMTVTIMTEGTGQGSSSMELEV